MCLIIETKREITIPKFVMEDMFQRNNDGFGFMYVRNGHSYGEKFHSSDLDLLYSAYLRLQEYNPFIHLRMKTHGDINEEMSHPYDCGYGVWLMHNGVMGECQGDDKTKSDTWYFANEYLRPIFANSVDVSELIRTEGFQRLITRFIGSNNRIVLTDRLGSVKFNPSSWHTIDNPDTECVGMKVSNTYAWDLWKQKKKHEVIHYPASNGEWHSRRRRSISGNTSPCRNESKPGDPAGSFRDLQDRLWLFNGKGWVLSDNFGFIGSQEATLSPPTCPSNNESASSSSIIVIENGKSDAASSKQQSATAATSPPWDPEWSIDPDSLEVEYQDKEEGDPDSLWREMYLDWLNESYSELDYREIYKRCKEQPDEAADFIALVLDKTINQRSIEDLREER